MDSKDPIENPEEPPQFLEKNLAGNEPARCVDGRPCPESPEGPQMLGGSLHPLVLQAIFTNTDLDKSTVQKDIAALREKGYTPGVHRGSRQNPQNGVCDCGFCDRLNEIIIIAQKNESEIKKRLEPLLKTNGLDPSLLDIAYDKIRHYKSDKIKSHGESLLLEELTNGAVCEIVEGEHAEKLVFVNFKKNTTFDTQKANKMHYQAFNLDLWMVQEQAQALGVDPDFAVYASLILYQATEMALVEQKGNSPLPLVIHR